MTFGRMTMIGDKNIMPLSVHVHHALMDGFHVGQFIEEFQRIMNE